MYKNSIIIHTIDNILVIVEELFSIYPQTDISRHEQKNKQMNEAMRQITSVMKRARKKGALSEYFQINNRNTKYQKIEHKLGTNTTVCKYLKNSRHGNLLLRKQSPKITDMSDAFIWTIFNLFDPNCNIDSKVRINPIIPKFLAFHDPLQYGHRLSFTYILVPSGKARFVESRSLSPF